MRTFKYLFLLLAIVLSPNCSKEELFCFLDIAVSALDAPAAVVAGNPVAVVCVIKNVINTSSTCELDSPEGTITVSVAHDMEDESSFSDFDRLVFQETYVSGALESGNINVEDAMMVPTDYGPGYYAIKVEAQYEGDTEIVENNARAISIRAN